MNTFRQSGQILLVTLLVLVILVTIGLALIGRVRVDTTITTDIEESLRAFSAAEAGVEEALKSGIGRSEPFQFVDSSVSYTTQVNSMNSFDSIYAFPRFTPQGEVETFWLVNHNEDQTINEVPFYTSDSITICWKGRNTDIPAVAIALLYKRGMNYRVARAGYDPNIGRGNNFASPDSFGDGCGQTNVYSKEIRFSDFNPAILVSSQNPDILIFLRIRPLYADSFLFIDGGGAILPNQGNLVTSIGTTGIGVTRKILVFQPFRSPGGIFDAAVISQTSFSK